MAGDAVSPSEGEPGRVCEGVQRAWAVCGLGGSMGLWRVEQGQNQGGKGRRVVNGT